MLTLAALLPAGNLKAPLPRTLPFSQCTSRGHPDIYNNTKENAHSPIKRSHISQQWRMHWQSNISNDFTATWHVRTRHTYAQSACRSRANVFVMEVGQHALEVCLSAVRRKSMLGPGECDPRVNTRHACLAELLAQPRQLQTSESGYVTIPLIRQSRVI